MKYQRYYEARDIIERFLRMDLVGPVDREEVIEKEAPTSYYAAGILHPRNSERDILEQASTLPSSMNEFSHFRDNTEEDSFDGFEDSVSQSNTYNPSSLALSTTLKPGVTGLHIFLSYGKYHLIQDSGDDQVPDIGGDPLKEGKPRKYVTDIWKREHFEKSFEIQLDNPRPFQVEPNLEVHVYIQKKYADGSQTITVAVVNTHESNKSQKVNNLNSFFQVVMEVSAPNGEAIFIEKKMILEVSEDEEIKNLNLLYSHVKNYAIGHGCSVSYSINDEGCYKLTTEVLPGYEIKQMKPSVRVPKEILKMKFLAQGNKDEVIKGLLQLTASYRDWIGQQRTLAKKLTRYQDIADKNLALCENTLDRLNGSIRHLENDIVFRAFQLANQAMLNQRVNVLKRRTSNINLEEITWYPFQLAFFLQEITSIVDPVSDERKLVDLLWFPTGGGKTEAYLGISAFVIFYRRLRDGKDNAGVTILMRYTLRLLTIQQFDRAAALICSCESLRRSQNLGGEEISIGLFVGGGLTPNKIDEAQKNLEEIIKNGDKSVRSGNPHQVFNCPACGTELPIQQYKIENNKLSIKCGNHSCEFHSGLPIYLVDEDIYASRPTLIISTIDKFARMTWEPRIAQIFGIGTSCPPPELIIQDELHLISGPLGTIAGLYEIAIDRFCYRNGIGPKIIASTATIRNAKFQIQALYGRDFRQFPPQGINIRDSYFAEESTTDDKPARKYLGVMSSNKTATTVLVRVYACLQFVTRYLKHLGFEDEVIDNYWTITGYFNSLRELGGAVVQVHDDVQDRYEFLCSTKFLPISKGFKAPGPQDRLEELTSRKNPSEIKKALEYLSLPYQSGDAFDYVLASNMISVGVDISRLGLMVVTGQPKSNSEYIQASSRVGRENPGLVITVYNASKSRDRSHYEQFINYHSAIYKYVEATSLTPFSVRARERALHAVYISMCRFLISSLRQRDSAGNYDMTDPRLREIEDFLLERARVIAPNEEEVDETVAHLEEIKYRWFSSIVNKKMDYDQYGANKTVPLLKNTDEEEGVFPTLNSMRNVDRQSNLYIEEE
ncbi:helicase-related protein [Paenibacillus barengoltzii]|uniref:Distinct helicase family with a unique C-terminal domain including a metal-binding cysteine cluster n=1 Tax=Paenibacillus barengoltzii J12 TaxID=935846 RepID=A0ABY1LYF5_9BACL|nr:helicase-related protein [Paenibacillus barengoltzii]SMF33576.1 Distinct helicase family with a unique C-terminal domain including a metal-binding cysteine cluster [Paenibacillus barengoltzii J12]